MEKVDANTGPSVLLERLFNVTSVSDTAAAVFVHVIPEPETAARRIVMFAAAPALAYSWCRRTTFETEPLLRYARSHSAPATAAEIARASGLGGQGLGGEQLGAEFASGYLVPVHGSRCMGRYSMLALGSHEPAFFESRGSTVARSIAHSTALALHKWWMETTRVALLQSCRLRPIDLRLLEWENQGLNAKQIARLLGCSRTAVDSKFQRLLIKLGTTSRKNAALRASAYELI